MFCERFDCFSLQESASRVEEQRNRRTKGERSWPSLFFFSLPEYNDDFATRDPFTNKSLVSFVQQCKMHWCSLDWNIIHSVTKYWIHINFYLDPGREPCAEITRKNLDAGDTHWALINTFSYRRSVESTIDSSSWDTFVKLISFFVHHIVISS